MTTRTATPPGAGIAAGRTLLVLAASEHQLAVIRAARRAGARVLTVDNVPDNPGHALADASFSLSTTDVPAILELARREGIDGVLAACTDVAVPTAAAVAAPLDLPGPPPRAATVLTDKLNFRAWQRDQGLPHPPFRALGPRAVDGPPRADVLALLRAAPAVLKPARSSGSKGIVVVRDAAEFAAEVGRTLAFCPDDRALIEGFLPGLQGTCEGVLEAGRVVWRLVTHRRTAPLPHCATHGHDLPSGLPAQVEDAVAEAVRDLLGRVGVTDGPFDCDFVADGDRVTIIEASPRLGGNALSALAAIAADVDLPRYAVLHALAVPARLRPAPTRPCAAVLLGVERAGVLSYDRARVAALADLAWVRELRLDAAPGAEVQPFTNGRHRVAAALITADDAAQLQARRAELEATLALTVT